MIATFFQVFPHGILWSNEHEGRGYDAVLFGQAEPTTIDVGELQRRLERPDHRLVRQSLREVGFGTGGMGFGEVETVTGEVSPGQEVLDLMATYSGQASLLQEWSRGAQINTDRNLRLQYLAGMSLNTNIGGPTLSGIRAYYRFPDRTFVGSPERIHALKQALSRAGRRASADLARDRPGSAR